MYVKSTTGNQRQHVTDLINGLVEILRLETEELRDAAWQAFELVEPWDEG